jgi:glucose-1-phosphate cytidylyltransferase
MKVVILAGGFGTRLAEETGVKPKPMVEIGGLPILWHIMKTYSTHGLNEFIICLGYKGYIIKEYFSTYTLQTADVTFDFAKGTSRMHRNNAEPWKVTLVETGLETMTGGRVKRVKNYIGDDTFCLTYGDGLCNVNIKKLIEYHKKGQTLATLTAVQPPGRFGAFILHKKNNKINSFEEKPKGDGAWINGGFFVLEPEVLEFVKDDLTVWEKEPMERLAQEGQLSAFRHEGFWQSMDSLRDKQVLEKLWQSGKAPWKIW